MSPKNSDLIVSVVIPTHNRPELLCKLLDSLENQQLSIHRFEIIVVASPNDACFKEPAKRQNIKYTSIINDPWAGTNPSAKRNHGARLATSAWIAFIDDDCLASEQWLSAASNQFDGNFALEGAKRIPPMKRPTFTYKGLKNFEIPGGFQSCNMFYRRDIFLKLGGFDIRFPFYLEDSDLAWTFLDAGYKIPHVLEAVVYHPVVPPQPQRLLHGALRREKLRLLQLKHPVQFQRNKFRILRSWHWLVLGLQLSFFVLTAFNFVWIAISVLGVSFALTTIIVLRWYKGCIFTYQEIFWTLVLLPILPSVALASYWLGCLKYRRLPSRVDCALD